MAQGASTVSSLNSLFNLIYEDALFYATEANIMIPLVTPASATGWAARKVPKYPDYPVAQQVDEYEDYNNPQELTKSAVTVTPYEYMAQAILTDRRIETDPDNARTDAARWLGQAISNRIEASLLGLFSSLTTGIGSAGSSLTLAKVMAAISILRNRSKGGGPIYVVLHPYQWYPIWKSLGSPPQNYPFQGEIANQALRNNFIGNWLGALWFQSANISIDSNDDAYGAVFTREAFILDTRKRPTLEPERDASLRAWELNMSVGYGVAIRRDEHGVYLLGDASTPTGA